MTERLSQSRGAHCMTAEKERERESRDKTHPSKAHFPVM
jgi:hypothetical protein